MWLTRSRKHCSLVCLCAAYVCATAQQPASTGSVSGMIRLADSGKAAAGVIVSLLPPVTPRQPSVDPNTGEFVVRDEPSRGDFGATVDTLGAFEIENVKPGDYFVLTYAPGYIAQDDYVFPGALAPERSGSSGPLPAYVRKIHVAAGGVAPVELRLERGGSIEGTIRFSDGQLAHTGAQAASGVAVSVQVKTKEGAFIRSGGAVQTDTSGRYRFDGLAPASYVVFVALPGKMVPTKRGSEGSGGEIVYASNTIRASRARVIEVRGMENHEQVDIDIPTEGLHKVMGKIVANTGAVVDSAVVRLYPSGESGLSRTTPLQADGSFSFDDVADEEYTISVEFHGEAEMLGLTEDKTGVRMRMKKAPYANVSLAIRVDGKDPPAVILRTAPTP